MTQRYLFIDRDGTIIEEPADEQVDSFSKLKFKKNVFKSLSFICKHLDFKLCLLYTSPSPRDRQKSRMPSSA